MNDAATITALQQQVETLTVKVALLEDALGATVDPATYGLSLQPKLARLFGLLMARTVVSRVSIHIVLWGDEERCASLVSVVVYKLREKLRVVGVEIETVRSGWGEDNPGYRIHPDAKAKLRALIRTAEAAS